MTAPDETVESLLEKATRVRQLGASADELVLLDRAVALHPENPRAHNARGLRALADRDFTTAIDHFGRASIADPLAEALLINLATAYRGKGDENGEQDSLQAVLDLDRRNLTAQLRMAELRQRQGKLSEAAPHWSAVVQLIQGLTDPSPALIDAAARGHAALREHNRIFAAALEEELGPKPDDRVTDRRFDACVEHMFGRRKIYQNECFGIHFPFLPADEYFERRHFPWMADLERHTPTIAAEALRLVERGAEAIRPYVRQEPGTPQNKWSALDNNPAWSACFLWEYGIRNDEVCALCPETAAALEAVPQSRLPGKAPTAFFSVLRPGAHIPPHTGVTNTRAIIHLPLVVPDDCLFRVGAETRPWRVGEAFAFDDTIEHEAWNNSDAVRIVLIFDVWNPHLTERERDQLTKLFTVTDRGLVSPRA
jgi:aspartyl/asparaginyl beta-hydroxylase (cupin superfamily)